MCLINDIYLLKFLNLLLFIYKFKVKVLFGKLCIYFINIFFCCNLGVLREINEEIKFVVFDIFDDKELLYFMFNFKYFYEVFKRFLKLIEFNILFYVEDIKNVIVDVIKNKCENGLKILIFVNEINNL